MAPNNMKQQNLNNKFRNANIWLLPCTQHILYRHAHKQLQGIYIIHSIHSVFLKRNLKLRLPKNFLIFEQNLAKNFLKIS